MITINFSFNRFGLGIILFNNELESCYTIHICIILINVIISIYDD